MRRWLLSFFLFFVCCGSAHAQFITVTWDDNSTDEDVFSIERRIDSIGSFAEIATVGANVESYNDTTIEIGTNYCYQIRARNTAGDSSASTPACGTATATPVLSQTRYNFYNFYGPLTGLPTYFVDDNVPLRVHIGSRFRVYMKVVNTTAQSASEILFPYVSINGASAVALPDTCTSSPIAFADVPEFGTHIPLTTRTLTQDQSTFVQGYFLEAADAASAIVWTTPPAETEMGVAIQICPTATLGQTFRLYLRREGNVPFASYDNATTPFFDVVSQRSIASMGALSGGGARQ